MSDYKVNIMTPTYRRSSVLPCKQKQKLLAQEVASKCEVTKPGDKPSSPFVISW